jgi:hypothetical protein
MARRTRLAIALLFILAVLDGGLSGALANAPRNVQMYQFFASTIAVVSLSFWWVHNDSVARGVRRSPLLNVGIVALAVVFVPVYLFRSREPGARLKAILTFFGLFVGYVVVAVSAESIVTTVA